jgi:hypothetical protein
VRILQFSFVAQILWSADIYLYKLLIVWIWLCLYEKSRRKCGTPECFLNREFLSAKWQLKIWVFLVCFIKRLLKSNTCPVVLHGLSLVHRFVDDLFVPDFPDLRIPCTLTKALLVVAYTQKPLVSWIVRLKASLVISWI